MISIIFLFLFFIIIIIIIIYKKNKNYENFNTNIVDINTYSNIMLNNDKKKLYKIGLNDNINIYEEQCFQKCDKTNCIKLENQKKILDDCLKCNSQKNKCFNKSIIGGNCDDCDNINIEDKLDCLDIQNFGCINPKNLNSSNGIKPYYFELNDNSLSNPFNKKCIFCWNIFDNI